MAKPRLSSEDQIHFDFYSRKLSEPGFDFDQSYNAVIISFQRLQMREALSDEQLKEFIAGYAQLRDIASLETFLDYLAEYHITPENMQKCCEFRDSVEKREQVKSEEENKGEVGFFKTKTEATFTFKDLVDLFNHLVSPEPEQNKTYRK